MTSVDTWRQCDYTGDALLDLEDEDGTNLSLRVPWEARHDRIGWGRRPRARWKSAAGEDLDGLVVSEGEAGVMVRDHRGALHPLPHGAFQIQKFPEPKQLLAKARVWVADHQRGGAHVAGYWRDVEPGPGQTFDVPERWGSTATVASVDDGIATVEHGVDGSKGRARMPLASVPHYFNDLNQVLPHPPTTRDEAIDGVLLGAGERIAKGNDGIVYRAPTGEAVKVSTTTPYHEHNPGHRTPDGAVAHLRGELEAHRALADLPMVPRIRGQEHDGRFFLVKPWAPEATDLTRAELDAIDGAVQQMHARGWTLNDQIQVGRDEHGALWFTDLGQATPKATHHQLLSDGQRLTDYFRERGHSREPAGEQLRTQIRHHELLLGLDLRDREKAIAAGRPPDPPTPQDLQKFAEWDRLMGIRAAEINRDRSITPKERMAQHDALWDAEDAFRSRWKASLPEPMAKADKKHPPIPAGARWITAHPNGEGTKGVPILIMPAGDGTHRVIGGADGSMNHLRLRDVASVEDMKKRGAQRRKEKAERRKAMTPAERQAEKQDKEAKQEAVKKAERHAVETVREKWGGVDEDLKDEDLEGLSEKAREQMERNHHRRQFKQAMKARKDIAEKLSSERMEQLEDEAAVDEAIRDHPDEFAEAHELAHAELEQIEAEQESRRAVRQPRQNRADSGERAREAADTARSVLTSTDRDQVQADLEELGGRTDHEVGQIRGQTASDEQRRRATELMDDALILAEAAEGSPPSPDPERAALELKVMDDALTRAGVDRSDHEAVRAALANEARIAMERAELARVKAQKFHDLEADGKGKQAMRALVLADVQRGLSAEVRDAVEKLGLRKDSKAPLKTAEVAEMLDVLRSFDKLRDAKKGLAEVLDDVEGPKSSTYDKSRRAFDLELGEPPDHVIENVEEKVRRELATRIVGLADEKSSDHAQAVTDGHYAKLADVSLGIDNHSHIDRAVVDAIGLKNASHLLRHALEQQGHKADALHDALVGHHQREQVKLTTAALRKAEALVPGIEDTVADVGDVHHAMAQLDAHELDIADAQRAIGSALGQMEATATLAQAMRGKPPEHLSIPLKDGGQGTLGSHLTWMHSVGLEPGDYEIDTAGKEIRIPKEKWRKLLRPEDREAVEQRKAAHAIKRGEEDEDGWMPQGMVSRASSSFTDPPPAAPRYHTALDLHADDMHTALADHIGARLADGERPADIATDLLSPMVAGKAADPEAFAELAREFFPLQTHEDKQQIEKNTENARQRHALTDQYHEAVAAGDTDKAADLATQISQIPKHVEVLPKRDVDFAEHYQELSAGYLRRHHPDAAPLHAASLYGPGVGEKEVSEAVFRALADHPEHVAAFTPIGALTHAHRDALQEHFYKRAGIAETRNYAAEFGERTKGLIADIESGKIGGGNTGRAAEAAGQGGMFGGGGGGLFGGGPPPKKEALTPETLGKLHPAEAKALAYEYPREGKELHAAAMGERPADVDPASSKLHPDVHAAIDAVRERSPAMAAPDLAKAAALHIGRQKALKEAGLKESDLTATDPVTGTLTPAARRNVAKIETRAADLQQRGIDPREVARVYGGRLHDAEREAFEAHAQRHSTPWASFVDTHGGLAPAYTALQHEMRGEFAKNMQEHYGKVTGKALQTGIAEVPNAELHAAALASPAQRQELAEARRQEVNALRERAASGARDASGKAIGGKFQQGSALERYRAAKDAERSHGQRQGGMFGAAPIAPPGKLVAAGGAEKRAPRAGERLALGAKQEAEIQALLGGNLGKQIDPKKKTRLFAGASMDGRRMAQQRVIKMIRKNKRVAAVLGVGSGKTATAVGAFTDLHASGDTTHGLFLVPKAVQNQFGEEINSFTEPGKYRTETGQGKSHGQRIDMLADKNVHMRVMTHESATKTILKLAADHHGIAPEAMLERLRGMQDNDRATTIRAALDAHGIPKHMTNVDEFHRITTRQGTQESDMSIVLGAMVHPINATHVMLGSGTPAKNDASEIHSVARLVDPERYGDRYRFVQSHGEGTTGAPDALRRELDHRTYSEKIPPDGVSRIDTQNPEIGPDGKKTPGGPLKLDPKHQQEIDAVQAAYDRAKKAHQRGDVDVEAVRMLSPGRFADQPEAEHEAIARKLSPHLGLVKQTATRRALQLAPIEHNAKLRRMVDTIHADLQAGKPGIVFADSLEEAHHVTKALRDRGIAAGTYHGGLDGKARDDFRKGFTAGQLQVGVMTSAGEAGINLTAGKVVHHYNVPNTAKSWTQRNGRAFRQGQKDDVETHNWVWDHDHDKAGVRRLQDKGMLGEVLETPLGPLDEHGIAKDYSDRLNQKHETFDVEGLADEQRMAAK